MSSSVHPASVLSLAPLKNIYYRRERRSNHAYVSMCVCAHHASSWIILMDQSSSCIMHHRKIVDRVWKKISRSYRAYIRKLVPAHSPIGVCIDFLKPTQKYDHESCPRYLGSSYRYRSIARYIYIYIFQARVVSIVIVHSLIIMIVLQIT